MGYREAIEAAGATVHVFQEFGSYQGTWLAKVTYKETKGWIEGAYGSCSGCDSFQAEFNYTSHLHGDIYHDPIYDGFKEGCQQCDDTKAQFRTFGESYLHSIVSWEQLTEIYRKKTLGEYIWDEDREIYEWLMKQGSDGEATER